MANPKRRGVKVLTLKDGRHVARWRDPWTRRQKQQSLDALGLTNQKQRERWAQDLAANLAKDRQAVAAGGRNPKRQSVTEAQQTFLGQKKAPRTVAAYRMPLRRLAKFLEDSGVRDVIDVRPDDLFGFNDSLLANQDLKVSTRNQHRVACRVWLYWCLERDLVHPSIEERNIRKALAKEVEARDFIEVLQRKEQRQLLRSALAHDADGHPPVAPFLLTILETGMRLGEARGLRFDEFDDSSPAIYLSAARTKTRRSRMVTLEESPAVVRLLEALRLQAGRRQTVFAHIDQANQESVRVRLQRDYEAPAFTWAMLRRTCGSLMVCGNIRSTFLVANRLGHSEQVAARHYHEAIRGAPNHCSTVAQAGGWEIEAEEVVQRVVAGQVVRPRIRRTKSRISTGGAGA